MSEVQVRVGRRLDVAALRLVASVQPALLLLQAAFAFARRPTRQRY